MGAAIDKYIAEVFPGTFVRRRVYEQHGHKSNFVTPEAYWAVTATSTGPQLDAYNTYSWDEFFGYSGIPPWAQHIANSAYEDFRSSALGSQAAVGVAFAEWDKSLGMIAKRGTQLAKAANDFRRGHVRQGLQTLGIGGRSHGGGRAARDAASLWLEYSYGWKPLYQDIYDAAEQISSGDLPTGHSRGNSRDGDTYFDTSPDVTHNFSRTIGISCGAIVLLDNPNLYLASQMGLVNPASVAWELVPFSFVVDWMVDISSFINSFTDFVGCTVTNPWYTCTVSYVDTYSNSDFSVAGIGSGCIRHTSLLRPFPNFNIQANLGTSITRAANATALATQAIVGLLGA